VFGTLRNLVFISTKQTDESCPNASIGHPLFQRRWIPGKLVPECFCRVNMREWQWSVPRLYGI